MTSENLSRRDSTLEVRVRETPLLHPHQLLSACPLLYVLTVSHMGMQIADHRCRPRFMSVVG